MRLKISYGDCNGKTKIVGIFCASVASEMSVILLSKCINRSSWLDSTANSPSILDPMFAVSSGYPITKQCVPTDTSGDL